MNEATPIPPEAMAKHRDRLERFVLRARRIEEHSLLRDLRQFAMWANGSGAVDQDAGTITFDLPPEEAFESLAVRVRPLLLERDKLHLASVIGSMKAFARGDAERISTTLSLRRMWDEASHPTYRVSVGSVDAGTGAFQHQFSHVELADAWMFGDLVHATAGGDQMPRLAVRYQMAVMLYGQVAMCAKAVLNVVRAWDQAGLLELDPRVWVVGVEAEVPLVRKLRRFVVTPVEE